MRQIFSVEGQDGVCSDPCVEAVVCAAGADLSKILQHCTQEQYRIYNLWKLILVLRVLEGNVELQQIINNNKLTIIDFSNKM